MEGTSVLWRRLDAPGHDACRLRQTGHGWQLEGCAVFLERGIPARLAYEVTCDGHWLSQEGRVTGWVGERGVDITAVRTRCGWELDGEVVNGLEDCPDLDLGFTPATNLIPLRRLGLSSGEHSQTRAAWLDPFNRKLSALPQTYERRAENGYWYEAPAFGYQALIELAPSGFIRHYPGLWRMEP